MTDFLENLIIHPDSKVRDALSADLLSHVLAQIRLTGDKVHSRALQGGEEAELDPESAHVLVATAGTLTLSAAEHGTVEIGEGDLLLLPHGATDLRLRATDGAAAYIICRFWFDPDSLRVMVFALPPWIHVRRDDGAGWLDGIVHFLLLEAEDVQPGAALMISRLIDLVVIRTLRSWVHQGHRSGWLGGLSDPRIARAVKAIHERPNQRWSIDALAAIAGMSRSSFSDRFSALVGRSPLRYHNEWRLALARGLLAKPDARVGEVGLSIGYESEAAFSRAYKARYGHSPRAEAQKGDGSASAWRRAIADDQASAIA
jgi:AraC-like DNA-binding protein